MTSLIKLAKKNILFIVLTAIILLCVIRGNTTISIPIVSRPDSEILFSTQQAVLEQTWQPNVKNITGIKIPYTSTTDFTATVKLTVYSDNYAKILTSSELTGVFRSGEEGVMELGIPKCKVTPGERIRIQLHFENVQGEGTFLLPSGSQYGGCTIDGIACNEAAAFYMLSAKTSLPLQMLAIFGPFIAFSLLFMILWNRKWEECVGLSMFAVIAVLYVTGLLDRLLTGMILVYVLAGIAFLVSAYLYNKKEISAKSLYSPALFVYALLFGLIVLNCKGAWFARWDEYSHWGLAVKDMFFYDSFAKHVNTTVMLPRYVPFATLIEYFFVFAGGIFSQELVYIAYQAAVLNVLIMICGVGRKRRLYLLPAVVVMVFLPVIFFRDIYNTIYVDSMLAVFMAYVLICYYTEELKGFNLLRVLGGLFALTLTKDMGMVIAGLLTAIMMADRLYHALHRKKKVLISLLCPCACALFVIGVYFSWQIYMSIPAKMPVIEVSAVNAAGTSAIDIAEEKEDIPMLAGMYEETVSLDEDFTGEPETVEETETSFQSTVSASGITLEGILGLLKHEDEGYRYQAIKNYLITIFDGDTFQFAGIGISYVDLYILLLLVIGGLSLFGFWGDRADKIFTFGIFTFLAGMCYSLVLELLYLFAFPMGEALVLVSHARYFGSFIGGVIIAFAFLLMLRASESNTEKRQSFAVLALLTAGIIICVPVEGLVMKNMDTDIRAEHVAGNPEIEEAFRSVATRAETAYFVCNGSRGDSYYIFKNVVSPVLIPYSEYDIYASEEIYAKQQDIWKEQGEEIKGKGQILSCDAWAEELKELQYVFLFHPGDVFQESYGELFEESDTIEDGAFYRVMQAEDGISLTLIGKMDVGAWK